MITLEDWALISRLPADGVPKARIAARLGISRTTVIKAVNSDSPPRYVRSPGPTSSTEFEPHVRALLAEVPDMPATVLAERWAGPVDPLVQGERETAAAGASARGPVRQDRVGAG